MNSPWVDQFNGLISRDAIKARVESLPNYKAELLSLSPHLATSALSGQLKSVISLSVNDLDILESLVLRSHAYASEAYPSVPRFLSLMNSKEIQVNTPAPICLTGLAGVGKSTLLTALQKALPDPVKISVSSAILSHELQSLPSARIDVDVSRDWQEILAPILWPEFENESLGETVASSRIIEATVAKKVRLSQPNAVKLSARKGYRLGIFALLVDEMQFVTLDSSANVLLTKYLLMLRNLNIPLIFAANYSACHKLMMRNQEDRDRLLADPIVVRPLELNDSGLGAFLRVYDKILGPCVDGSLCQFLPDYAAMTLGIKRKIQDLTVAAYRLMRSNNETTLMSKHLKSAYEQGVSSSFRKDIDSLVQINGLTKSKAAIKDLWCPFGLEYNRYSIIPNALESATEAKITPVILRQSLTGAERKLVESYEQRSNNVKTSPIDPAPQEARRQRASNRKPEISAAELTRSTLAHKNHD